jgi:hypothetical protein
MPPFVSAEQPEGEDADFRSEARTTGLQAVDWNTSIRRLRFPPDHSSIHSVTS